MAIHSAYILGSQFTARPEYDITDHLKGADLSVKSVLDFMSRPLLALVFVGAASALKHSFLTQHAPHHAVRAALLMAEPKLMVHVE